MAELHHPLAVSTWRGHARKRSDAALHPEKITMQRIVITAVLVAGFAGSAPAESSLAVPSAPFASTKTHAEVQADLAAYQKAGVNPWSASYNQLRGFRSTNTREEVTAAYMASRDEVHAMTGEDSGSGAQRTATAQPARSVRTLAVR
jgi:hypothetical protein